MTLIRPMVAEQAPTVRGKALATLAAVGEHFSAKSPESASCLKTLLAVRAGACGAVRSDFPATVRRAAADEKSLVRKAAVQLLQQV